MRTIITATLIALTPAPALAAPKPVQHTPPAISKMDTVGRVWIIGERGDKCRYEALIIAATRGVRVNVKVLPTEDADLTLKHGCLAILDK